MITREEIRTKLLELAAMRANTTTFCPSEVARSLSADWRPLMPLVREEAAALVDSGVLICTQRGQIVHPLSARGAIRLARCPKDSGS
ncbi:MAG: DUF3253 domain-containing protein [Verrucomicrobiaceae bacterium]|nr:DUF3253 domain-containing protein [Verrucomicrobiaceae bacterium]